MTVVSAAVSALIRERESLPDRLLREIQWSRPPVAWEAPGHRFACRPPHRSE